jgi:universal stress protein family protein
VEHVIALVDGSDAGLTAAQYGERLATSARGRLTIAIPQVQSHWAAAMDPSTAIPVPPDEVEYELLCRLSKLLDGHLAWQLLTLKGEPAKAIAALAADTATCVVVVGTGTGALGWWRTSRLIRTLSRRYGLSVVLTGQAGTRNR